jgi:uncharacterized protein (DUF433 family)
MVFKYLETRNDVLGGKMCVKGTRIRTDLILEWMAGGSSTEDIITNYPQVKKEAISEVLQYAAEISRNTIEIESIVQTAA